MADGSNASLTVEGGGTPRPKLDSIRFMVSAAGSKTGTLSIVAAGRQTLLTVDESDVLKAIETGASALRRMKEGT